MLIRSLLINLYLCVCIYIDFNVIEVCLIPLECMLYFKICWMSVIRKGILLHALLLCYPLLTLVSALKVNHFLS